MFFKKRRDRNAEEQYPNGWSAEDDLRSTLDQRTRELKKALEENYQLRQELERAQLGRIEAANPGIDIDRVRRERMERGTA